MNPERFKPREKINVENTEFLAKLRIDIIDRVRTKYPDKLGDEEFKDFLDKFEKGEIKTYIDSWTGDAFAWVAKQEYKLDADEYEKARELLFTD